VTDLEKCKFRNARVVVVNRSETIVRDSAWRLATGMDCFLAELAITSAGQTPRWQSTPL
jgi:hypothetical protein